MHDCRVPSQFLFRFKNKNWRCRKCSKEYKFLGKEEWGYATVIKWCEVENNSYIKGVKFK